MILTIRQMEILVAAADAMNFSEAAERLGITQPSLSETIRRMEAELGLRLFERTTRSLSLTPDGRHAVAVAREVVRDFRFALETIAHRAQSRRSRVTVAALPSVACAVLPEAIQGLRREFPQTEVGVQDVLHERAVGLVADGLTDIALTIRPAKLADLTFEELGSDPVHLVCRSDHPLAASEKVHWRELAAYPFVGLARTSSVRRLTDAAFTLSELAVEPAYEVEQIPSAAALVEAGLGVTALPALTLAMFRGSGLVVRPLGGPLMRRHVGVVSLSGRPLSHQAIILVGHLKKSFARALHCELSR
jgi:LysR family transcriptional regulator, carnitine catabolism transcriptional activator